MYICKEEEFLDAEDVVFLLLFNNLVRKVGVFG